MSARLGMDGDLADYKLRYGHPDNSVHQSVHANIYLAYISRLQEHLRKRFPDHDILVALAALFSPVKLTSPAAQVGTYASSEVKFLGKHYSQRVRKGDLSKRVRLEWASVVNNPSLEDLDGDQDGSDDEDSEDERTPDEVLPYLDAAVLEREWLVALPALRKTCQDWKENTVMTTADVAWHVILNHRNVFPNVVLVVCAGFAIPIGTADNERGFSDLKLHRTRLRILLGDSTLEELMRICLEGPTQHTPEYRALRERVIAYWAGQRERRCDARFDMPSRLAIARRRRQKEAKAARKMQKKLNLQKFTSRQKNARRRADRRASRRTEREKKARGAERRGEAKRREAKRGEGRRSGSWAVR